MKISVRLVVGVCVVLGAQSMLAADEAFVPPSQCLNQCELAGSCTEQPLSAFGDFDATLAELESDCPGEILFAVEGVCGDGRRLLRTGTGYTSEIRLYTLQGTFDALLTQTDAVVAPCMGQGYWPHYAQCEVPTVVRSICGPGPAPGAPAFHNRWDE